MPNVKEKIRCPWCLGFDQYIQYHDEEWGVPVHDDRKHFEFLILEGAQAGLSWSMILKKRDGYRKAFADFDPVKVSRFTENKIEKLLLDPGIVRNRLKIAATIINAKAFMAVQKEFGSFDAYIWSFVDGKPVTSAESLRSSLKTGSRPALLLVHRGEVTRFVTVERG